MSDRIAGAIIIVAAVVGIGYLTLKLDGSRSASSGPPQPQLTTGGYAKFVQDCHVAPTKADFDRLQQLLRAKDKEGILLMALAKKTWLVNAGERCRVIDPGFEKCEIRILEGDHYGESCFILRDFLGAQ